MTSFLRYIPAILRRSPRHSQVISRIVIQVTLSGLALSLSLFGLTKPGAAATTTLSFDNTPTLVSGTDRTQGAVYRFPNVAPGIDALVQLATIQNAQLRSLDSNTTFPARFQPTIAPSALALTNNTSFVRFDFKLISSATPSGTSFAAATALNATNVYFSAQDVDGNSGANTIREFIETIGATTTYVADPTLLQRMTTPPVPGGTGFEQIDSANVQPGIGTDDRYEVYSFLGASVSTFSIVGGNLTGTAGCILNNAGCDRQNSYTFNVDDIQRLDFGDAPVSFGDAYHPVPTISPSVFLGTLIDGDDGPNYTPSANGDDITGIDDEDGVASFPTLLINSTSYSLNATCVSNGATVAGWIDFNKNNVFDNATERASGTCNGSNVTLTWNGLSGLTAGNTFVRLRTASLASEVANPIGLASDGEVEDYQVAISETDYSDAPINGSASNENDTNAYGDATHLIISGTGLGATIDGETASLASADAEGDDDDGTDDEDGITFQALTQGQTATITANVAGAGGFLQGWIDWNGDGDFADTGEQIATNIQDNSANDTDATVGTIAFDITVPATAIITNPTFTRFRWSTTQNLNSTAAANDGEVEDYRVAISQDLSNKACPNVIADLWFANDESGSVDTTEFNDALDFLYQLSDKFVYDDVTGMKAGITAWSDIQASVEVIIPITETFGDPDDFGLISDPAPVTVDGDNRGLRELYRTRQNTSTGTRLDFATTYLADLIDDGNGRRAGVPQVAIILTDAFSSQISSAGQGGGSNWTTAASTLRNAGPDGTKVVVILIEAAATAYNNNDPGVRSTVDAVVGGGALFVATTYSDVADSTQNFITGVANTICDTAVSNDPNVLLVKRITRINGQTSNGGTSLDVYVDDPTYPYDDNTLDNPTPDPIDTENWPTPSGYLRGVISGGQILPGDEIEYTIYFLSSGDSESEDLQICDRIPESQTFVPNAFNSESPAPGGGIGANRGISVEYNGSVLSYSNDDDGDTARFYPPGVPLPSTCDVVPAPLDDNGQPIDNGAVVVNLGNVPNATSSGTPITSYGLLRFRATVD